MTGLPPASCHSPGFHWPFFCFVGSDHVISPPWHDLPPTSTLNHSTGGCFLTAGLRAFFTVGLTAAFFVFVITILAFVGLIVAIQNQSSKVPCDVSSVVVPPGQGTSG